MSDLWWLVVPGVLVSLFYCSAALMVWPYARPILPVWILFFAILIPPLFPFLLLYLAIALCTVPQVIVALPPVVAAPVVVVEKKPRPPTRGPRSMRHHSRSTRRHSR